MTLLSIYYVNKDTKVVILLHINTSVFCKLREISIAWTQRTIVGIYVIKPHGNLNSCYGIHTYQI